MTSLKISSDPFFIPFITSHEAYAIPDRFTLFLKGDPHPLCSLAAEQLQNYLKTQDAWKHNFGLSHDDEGVVVGKMFGVLVVKNQHNELGYLAAFSGKLAGSNDHDFFVPPVFDLLIEKSFLNTGMEKLSLMNVEIKIVEERKNIADEEEIKKLKTARKNYSIALQQEIFERYHFLNKAGEEKSLNELFKNASYKNPPSGAGECAGPKLLQYAFQQSMNPIALVEFWWGQSPKSSTWKHGHFYACCKEKCEPILAHMLVGIDSE